MASKVALKNELLINLQLMDDDLLIDRNAVASEGSRDLITKKEDGNDGFDRIRRCDHEEERGR